jgi:hypothetical protein
MEAGFQPLLQAARLAQGVEQEAAVEFIELFSGSIWLPGGVPATTAACLGG